MSGPGVALLPAERESHGYCVANPFVEAVVKTDRKGRSRDLALKAGFRIVMRLPGTRTRTPRPHVVIGGSRS
jgi:hypothetical protein